MNPARRIPRTTDYEHRHLLNKVFAFGEFPEVLNRRRDSRFLAFNRNRNFEIQSRQFGMVDTEPDAQNHIRAVATMVVLDLELNIDDIGIRVGIRWGEEIAFTLTKTLYFLAFIARSQR